MNYSSYTELFNAFYKDRNGKGIETDPPLGYQCVALFKWMRKWLGDPNWKQAIGGDGYAWQIQKRFKELGLDKWFDLVSTAKYGDILVYGKTSETPASHVSFYVGSVGPVRHLSWGQNQSKYDMRACTIDLANTGIIAILRPKASLFKKLYDTGFYDVPDNEYFSGPIKDAKNLGIITGSDGYFRPFDSITRGEVMTMLWRLKGSQKTNQINPFTDVGTTDYYYQPIMWATTYGITAGTGSSFRPKATCTRAEAITFLYRLCGAPLVASAQLPFEDVPATAYYHQPIAWAYGNGIVTGKTASRFDPDGTCSRADFVTMLMRTYHR